MVFNGTMKNITVKVMATFQYTTVRCCIEYTKSTYILKRENREVFDMKLTRTKQCKLCPWKKDVNPRDIPNGYCETKHKNLKNTIAQDASLRPGSMHVMSCHHSSGNDNMYCIGWLVNQLGPGNNIGLRIKMLNCENAQDIELTGEQHERFEDTLPN